jgi:hypothetical protein
MADKRRFDLFAKWIVDTFPGPRIWDVAGGAGKLNEALTKLGRACTTFDRKEKHLDVPYVVGRFDLERTCECDLVVGMHSDGATRLIVEYAARHRIPFAVVPCCSDNSMSYKPWVKHVAELATQRGFARVETHDLPMEGRARIVAGWPS